jgi:hypothetical protein
VLEKPLSRRCIDRQKTTKVGVFQIEIVLQLIYEPQPRTHKHPLTWILVSLVAFKFKKANNSLRVQVSLPYLGHSHQYRALTASPHD